MALTKVGKEGITGISNSSDATAITIDSSENVLVGKTSSNIATEGIELRANDDVMITQSGDTCFYLNRLSTAGSLIDLRQDGSTVGTMGSNGGGVFLEGPNYGFRIRVSGDKIFPSSNSGAVLDNVVDWGTSDARWDDIFATNGTIQTSDENEKQQIASLTDAEITAAKAISKLFKTFKWNDKVEAKGDAARRHAGVIAQEVQTAMTDSGLDATDYAFWCSDTWWETSTDVPAVEADEENGIEAVAAYTRTETYYTAEEAPEGATQRNRKGIRYPELLAFIGAATEQRLASIETRLTALENA